MGFQLDLPGQFRTLQDAWRWCYLSAEKINNALQEQAAAVHC